MDRPLTIDPRLQGFESFYKLLGKDQSNASFRGLYCEYLVALRVLDYGGKLLAHRFRTAFSEVDLYVENKYGERRLVEVKSVAAGDWRRHRLSDKQAQRLYLSLQALWEEDEACTGLDLALVNENNQIEWICDPLIGLIG